MSWDEDQKWENDWWGTCQNTFGEEEKQFIYAEKMGLKRYHDGKSSFSFSSKGYILDIGGGPVSMLLKCPMASGVVADPCPYPSWVEERYTLAGIEYAQLSGEELDYRARTFDEVWIYNCLQHVAYPERVVENALHAGSIIRVFEWLEVGVTKGHPQNLTETLMNKWFRGYGKVEQIRQNGCVGLCYYGIFLHEEKGK